MPEKILSGSLTEKHPVTLRGNVDVATSSQGIVGWLVDLRSPHRRHYLELVAGETVLATVETIIFRDDLGFLEVPEMSAGFRFPPTSLLRLLELPLSKRPKYLSVRVAGTDWILGATASLLTDHLARLAGEIAELRPEQSHLDPCNLLLSLQERRNLACALLNRPFRPQAGEEIGYLELVCSVSSDLLLFIGWMRSTGPVDLAAVIVSGEKYPAGLRGFLYSRSDLPPDAMGFAALTRTDWRPSLESSFILYWGSEQYKYIKSNTDWRLISIPEAHGWFSTLDGVSQSVELAEIRRNLAILDLWEPLEFQRTQLAIHYGIDRVLLVPGFGAFVKGWILSPWKQVRDLSLRMADQVLQNDPRCFSVIPRPDLASAFKNYADTVASAGFSAVFRGGTGIFFGERPLLKIHFEDDTSVVLAIDPQVVRTCDRSDSLDTAVSLLPSLPYEPFFEEFATVFGQIIRRNNASLRVIFAAPCRRAVIIGLPIQFDDVCLTFETIDNYIRILPADVGIVILCTPEHHRARIMSRFEDLRDRAKRPLSLIEIHDPAYAIWSLKAVIEVLHIEDFWFVSPMVLPTPLGWQTAADRFKKGRSDLELFVAADWQNSAYADEAVSLSFAWTAADFTNWGASAPVFLSGFYRDNRLPTQPAPPRWPGAVARLQPSKDNSKIYLSDARIFRNSKEKGALDHGR